MAIDYRGIRSLTARELITALTRDVFQFVRQKDLISVIATATLAHYGSGDTFTIKTLMSIIESQAQWTEDDKASQIKVRAAALRTSFPSLKTFLFPDPQTPGEAPAGYS